MPEPKHTRTELSGSEAQTRELGRRLALELRPGDVVALHGDLGAGKTCFVSGLAEGLKTSGGVTSPTFALVHEYDGPTPLYHLDLYRLSSAAELEDLDADAYFYGRGVTVVEWAERAAELLPAGHWAVGFEILDDHTRRIRVRRSSAPEDAC